MNFDPSFLKQLSLFGIGFAAAFLVALWLSLIFWTNRDIRSRSRDGGTRVLAILIVTLLFLPGFLIYLVMRPAKTLEEEYQHALEEEALLQTIEGAVLCPGCERHIQSDWLVCPTCNTLLKKTCDTCGRLVELSWNVCPYCATPLPGIPQQESPSESTAAVEIPQGTPAAETSSEDAEPSPLDDTGVIPQ